MRTIYEAFDGEQFEEECDCIRWELGKDLRELRRQGQFGAYRGDKNPTDEFDSADYFVIKTNTAAQALWDYFDGLTENGIYYENACNPFEEFDVCSGFYIYSYPMEHWIDAFTLIEELKSDAGFFELLESDFEEGK